MKVYVVNMYISFDDDSFQVAHAAFSKKEAAIVYMEKRHGMTQKSNTEWWGQVTGHYSRLEANLSVMDIDEFFEKYFNTPCVAEEE
jgi:hypothetical protein